MHSVEVSLHKKGAVVFPGCHRRTFFTSMGLLLICWLLTNLRPFLERPSFSGLGEKYTPSTEGSPSLSTPSSRLASAHLLPSPHSSPPS